MPVPREKSPAVGSTQKMQTPNQNTVSSPSSNTVGKDSISSMKAGPSSRPDGSAKRIPTREEIEAAAYQRYLERGGIDGFAEQDWLEAESELIEGSEAQRKVRAKGA